MTTAARTPRITVITPSLNHGRYLERAMCSVIDQGYGNLEYLVVDGGSDDESLPLIQHYDDEITWWRSQRDGGPADAINHALRRATGEIICILSADNLLLPGALEAAAAAMAGPDGAEWLVGHSHRIGPEDESIGQASVTAPASLDAFLMHDSGHLPLTGSFYRRSMFENLGMFDGQKRFAYGYELHCRLLAAGVTPTILPQMVAAHREHGRSLSAEQTLQMGLEHIAAAEDHAEALPLRQRYALWKNCGERRRIYALALAETRLSDARRFLWQQLLKRPWWLASDHYRQTLLYGPARSTPDDPRPAAAA